MKKYIFIIPLFLVLGFFTLVFFWWKANIVAPSSSGEKIRFVIDRGSSAEVIGKNLAKEGLIKNSLAFKLYTTFTKTTTKIPPGEFMVPQNLDLENLVKYLMKGPEEYWVTIPEGLRREEIAEKFVSAFSLKGEKAQKFRTEFLSETKNQEGYLFPDSYLFPPDASAATVVKRLLDTFDTKTKDLSLSLEDVILASVIERETKTAEERPIVAGIYMNRLELGMPLQADATAQYAVANKRCSAKTDCDWWVTPTLSDLEISSPYNTYKNPGLPIGPISNPGITSLKAAVNSTESDYLYYIHDDSGQIYYAKTLDQHNSNVQKYLR